ncbi:MAG: MmcQ/YjbR family DNA-binding protein [Chitinophagaceae bacterium]|nr:MmcQ/YjbR family DNA-binding protein [Chitinophagaceae bacterium]
MTLEDLHQYCISKEETVGEFPFDRDTLAFKVKGKIFALTSMKKWEEQTPSINLKCNPEKSIQLREHYNSITPGYHMNKKHWNTIQINKEVTDTLLYQLIDHSYNIICKSSTKKTKIIKI